MAVGPAVGTGLGVLVGKMRLSVGWGSGVNVGWGVRVGMGVFVGTEKATLAGPLGLRPLAGTAALFAALPPSFGGALKRYNPPTFELTTEAVLNGNAISANHVKSIISVRTRNLAPMESPVAHAPNSPKKLPWLRVRGGCMRVACGGTWVAGGGICA